jgi:hypothetical protein
MRTRRPSASLAHYRSGVSFEERLDGLQAIGSRRMTRGQCVLLCLHREGLSPSTLCRSPEHIGFVLQKRTPPRRSYLAVQRETSLPLFTYCRAIFLCLAANAKSTRRRIASDRDGLSGCSFAQASIAALKAGDSRMADTGSFPVAGRPRFFLGSTFFVDIFSIFR